jgi:cytochrome P450
MRTWNGSCGKQSSAYSSYLLYLPGSRDFEADFPKLVFNVMPSVIAPTGHRSRAQFQEALKKYYSAHHDLDPSVSQFVQTRSKFIRDAGIPDDEVARLEIMLPFAAIVNTVPSMFWLICFILPKPDLVARLRPEVENLIKRDGNEVTINTGAVEEQCPLLMSCYRETLRVTNHQVSTRTVLEDTVISDGNGNSYLLKKDVVVQMSIGTSHAIEEYWGPDVSDFNPDRFLQFSNRKTGDSSGPGSPKAIRAAFQPFGGGHHLCPGRNFAFAEMIALITTILLGYEMDPLDGDWVLPDTATWSLVDAITKPVATSKGIKLHLYRREGWEHVTWKYEV